LIIIKLTSSLILLFIPLLLGTLLYKFTGLEIFFIYAEDVISIIPGSANYDASYQFSITRFFDNNFFPIKKNNTLTWYNADNVEHTILLSFKNGFYLLDPNGIEVFKQSMHSGWGVESASYSNPDNQNYTALISIKGILFQPVEHVDARFKISP
jgi:hypothetical protein